MTEWVALLAQHADKLPFVAAVRGVKVQLSVQRITEAAVIGVVLAAIGYVAVIPSLEQKIAAVREDIARLESRVESIDKERQADYRELSSEVRRGQNGNRRNGGAK